MLHGRHDCTGSACSSPLNLPLLLQQLLLLLPLLTISSEAAWLPADATLDIDANRLGCLLTDQVCNDDEVCFDDAVFGRCVNSDDPDESFMRAQSLSDGDKALIVTELDKLDKAGYEWNDLYTQCLLQNIWESVAYNTIFDETNCDLFDDGPDDGGDDRQRDDNANDDDDDESGDGGDESTAVVRRDNEYVPTETEMLGGDGSVVPKKMILTDSDYDNEDNHPFMDISRDDDGSILVEPNEQDLLSTYLTNADDGDVTAQEEDEFLIPYQPELEREELSPYGTDGEVDLATYLAVQDALENAVDDVEGVAMQGPPPRSPPSNLEYADEQILWPADLYPADGDGRTNDVRKLRKRGGGERPTKDLLLPENIDLSTLLETDYPYVPDYDYANYAEDDYPTDLMLDPASNIVQRVPGAGGLGSRIFNRNERLDVKKPGPFFKNSANNFFLDKLLDKDYRYAEAGNDKNGTSQDPGQLEYEMPLLAPVKDKRELILEEEMSENGPKKNFVHIKLKNGFNTWVQGSDFIKLLATQFGIPEEALADRKIETQHVQFRVDPNPQNVDAPQMAKRIDQDSSLRGVVADEIGVNIDKAAPGERDDISSVMFPSGSNFNLLLLVVVSASTAAALLAVGVLTLLAKRRSRLLRKQGLLSNEEGANGATDEYKQLCRDWSRSSKKAADPANKATAKKIQNQESKESQRSSTSSWPEEPNTTNMDISTGHMVLAYMEDHLKNKQRLEQEWVSLCGYEAEPCATTIAFKAENKKKNRYPDKLPYDHNRVILNAMVNAANSDYINASTITDHDPRNPSYLVTQAPLSNTVADFWQMIWEQGCVVIVMLTRLQDNGHQLCHRYWPEEGSEQYHIFEVHLVSEHVWCDDYLVRSVYLKNTRTGETRTVTQFHFRSWPAHGVPTSTKALLEFRRKVNKSYRGRSCPICIHCSDGVGRSGTYTLLDMVLNRISKGCKEIDIAATLEHIRDQRGGMVQSKQQFEFCLTAVAEEVHAILKALPQ